jgi:hypothetical protein
LTLGRTQGIALYAGAVLGSGVLVIPAVAAELASLVAWGAMTLLTLPLALAMSLLSVHFPGEAAYPPSSGKHSVRRPPRWSAGRSCWPCHSGRRSWRW